MARARIAAVAALVLVLLLGATAAAAPGAVRPTGRHRTGRRRMAAFERAPRRRGRHGRGVGIGRVRRADERVGDGRGSRRSRGRVRHQQRQHRDAEGLVVDAAGPRAGPAPAGRERVGDLRGLGRRDVLGRLRGDRRRDRRPADRRPAPGRRRLGRCDERLRRGDRRVQLRRRAARSSDGRGVRSAIPSTRTTTRRTSSSTRRRWPRAWRPDRSLRRARRRRRVHHPVLRRRRARRRRPPRQPPRARARARRRRPFRAQRRP